MNARKSFVKILVLMTIFLAFSPLATQAYCAESRYISDKLPVYITTARLNLRPTPCTSQERLALLQEGTVVFVIDFGCGEWYEVFYSDMFGFVYAAYVTELIQIDLPAVATSFAPAVAGEIEMLHWRDARNVMTIGTIATLIDVRTGLTWNVASFSNGNHADIETITADDTAIKKQAFGGSWTWTPRPVLVLINGRTLAASVNGMPHGGSTRSGNNMNGHVCLHFYGSSTHRYAPGHVRDHQNAVREAFNSGL